LSDIKKQRGIVSPLPEPSPKKVEEVSDSLELKEDLKLND
jgi:hypothetical protein